MKAFGLKVHSNYIKLLAHCGAVVTMVSWGTSFLSTKVLMIDGGFSPTEMFVYRFACAYLLLLLITLKKIFANNWKDELQLCICGMCAGTLYYVLENYALRLTTTANVSLLASISPLFTTILLAIVYKIKIKAGVIIGSIIAFIGVGCIIFSSGEGFEINPKGDLLALSASLSWAIYTIVVKRLNNIYSSLFITRKLFFYGVLTALPLLIIQEEPLHLSLLFSPDYPQYFFNFMFLVIMCSVVGFLIWSEIMKILGAVTANNYIYLQPLVTMVAGYFVLGENIFLFGYIGCVLIIGGLVIADKLNIGSK